MGYSFICVHKGHFGKHKIALDLMNELFGLDLLVN